MTTHNTTKTFTVSTDSPQLSHGALVANVPSGQTLDVQYFLEAPSTWVTAKTFTNEVVAEQVLFVPEIPLRIQVSDTTVKYRFQSPQDYLVA